MVVSQDAYVSFRGAQRRDFGEVTHPRPVIFVDLASPSIDLLRSIPPAFVGQRNGTLLLRLSDALHPAPEHVTAVRALAARWEDLALRIAVLSQPVGRPPTVQALDGSVLPAQEVADVLRRARAVELEALLEFGQAIWRPTTYHYRLITGEHAEAYIKLGDAIREPRDAEVLASWLHEHLVADVGLVFDTGTLTPVAQALRLAAAQSQLGLGPVSMLDDYPRTSVDVDAILDTASGDAGRVVVTLSISSSGSLLERVLGALGRKGESLELARIAVLVSKGGTPASEAVDAWTPLPGQQPLVPRGARDEVGCILCRQPGKAAVIPINPFTFDAMLPTQLRQVVPDIKDPAENRGLWEAAQRTGALAVERHGHIALRRYRSDKVPMGIVLAARHLIGDDGFRAELRAKLRQRRDEEGMPTNSDLVLTPEHERGHPGFEQFWDSVRDAVTPDVELPETYPISGDFSDALKRRVRGARSILVFQLGAVSGASLQRALVGIQDARSATPDFHLHAFVVHVRPATLREWQTIRNSFGRRGAQPQLRYGWRSILPDRSPLREEAMLLRRLDPGSFDDAAETFLTRRLELCGGKYRGDRPAVLWGSSPDSHLTPNSIYGQRLDAVSTYVAVGSAMAAALLEPRRMIPELPVFEMAAMGRSYYDPLILGCFLRWVRPHEAFWGWTAAEAETTALHILDRAERTHQHILVPEMLLAAAQGKLTAEAAGVAVRVAEQLHADAPIEVRAALDVGARLLGDPAQLPPTEGVHEES